VTYGIIDKRGAYFRYHDTLLGQGRENAKTFLAENPDMLNEMEGRIRQEAGLRPRVQVSGPGEDGDFGAPAEFD
jgi:recombination protein RecA